jgi:hypothetical protein
MSSTTAVPRSHHSGQTSVSTLVLFAFIIAGVASVALLALYDALGFDVVVSDDISELISPGDCVDMPVEDSEFVPHTIVSLLLGWWGFPWGPILTIGTITTNFCGGNDVTDAVLATMRRPPPPSAQPIPEPSAPAPSAAAPAAHPPAWLPDPGGRYEYRYWDGANWSHHIFDSGVQATDLAVMSHCLADEEHGHPLAS